MSKKRNRRPASPAPVAAPAPVSPREAPADVSWWRAVFREPLALGLVPMILVRPLLDGITYPTDNFYFVWGLAILFALWASRTLLRGETIRFGVPILLLAGFWGIAAVTALDTVQFDGTNRTLILWAGHFFLFVITTNGLRSKTAIGIVLAAFVAASFGEALWSLIHLRYIIPFMREAIVREPRLLQMYFGTDVMNAELEHRLMVNRAFGSLLFPNALAALLILGIPFALTGSVHSVVVLARALRAKRPAHGVKGGAADAPAAQWTVLSVVLGTWVTVILLSYFLFTFAAQFEMSVAPGARRAEPLPLLYSPQSGYHMAEGAYVALWLVFVLALPILIALAAGRITRRHGIGMFGHAIRVWVLPPFLITELTALWFTYSRGGVLALAMASAFTAVLFFLSRRRNWDRKRSAGLAAAAGVALALLMAVVGAEAQAQQQQRPRAQPQQQAQPAPAQQQQAQPAHLAGANITREGKNLSVRDLMNPSSFRLRVTYWKSGLDMAMDNFWTGVGLGNFGAAYPKYQRLGAGDVKAAHNDYLQALCETGVFGFLAFGLFWAYIVLWGARRIWRETDPLERWVLAGLYGGVLAFLTHSLLDFNFFNPALAFFAFLLAGVFLARASLDDPPRPKSARSQLIALPLLVGAALIVGMALRIYLCDFSLSGRTLFSVGNRKKMNVLFDAGCFFMQPPVPGKDHAAQQMKDIFTVTQLIPDRSVLESIGSIRVSVPNAQPNHRALRPEEPIPVNAFFIMMPKLSAVQEVACEYIELWLEELRWADSIYPHNPDLAGYFIRYYDLLAKRVADPEAQRRYALRLLEWSEEGVTRNPEHFLYHEYLAKALELRAALETGAARKDYFQKALAEYKRSVDLYSISTRSWSECGQALIRYGQFLEAEGSAAEGEAQIAKGNEMLRAAESLQ